MSKDKIRDAKRIMSDNRYGPRGVYASISGNPNNLRVTRVTDVGVHVLSLKTPFIKWDKVLSVYTA